MPMSTFINQGEELTTGRQFNANTANEVHPRYLYRVWCDQSNGTNSPTLFEPALKTSKRTVTLYGMTFDLNNGRFSEQLKTALYGHDATQNPSIFTTVSLLWAFQHAFKQAKHCSGKVKKGQKKVKGHNIRIECIDTTTAENADGEKVCFRSVTALMKDLQMGPLTVETYPYNQLDYSDVYVTTDAIRPGTGSWVASLDSLMSAGLSNLYPEYGIISKRGNPGLGTPIIDLRNTWLRAPKDLKTEEISLAARLALEFKPVHEAEENEDRQDRCVPNHLLSALVALKGQDANGEILKNWLETYSRPLDLEQVEKSAVPTNGVTEVRCYAEIYSVISKRQVAVSEIDAMDANISPKHIGDQQRAYNKLVRERNLRKAADYEAYQKTLLVKSLKRQAEQIERNAAAKKSANDASIENDEGAISQETGPLA